MGNINTFLNPNFLNFYVEDIVWELNTMLKTTSWTCCTKNPSLTGRDLNTFLKSFVITMPYIIDHLDSQFSFRMHIFYAVYYTPCAPAKREELKSHLLYVVLTVSFSKSETLFASSVFRLLPRRASRLPAGPCWSASTLITFHIRREFCYSQR